MGGATWLVDWPCCRALYFNPRSPWGERLVPNRLTWQHWKISIHAPRGGSDRPANARCAPKHHFNPRSPWGERLSLPVPILTISPFQSTLPVGGATFMTMRAKNKSAISIHAPRGGSDSFSQTFGFTWGDFNPRSPWGERPRQIKGGR